MPTFGNISQKCRRCLENIAVNGPSSAAELDALDPTAPHHRQTLKAAQQSGYVVLESQMHYQEPARYSLTAKARALLAGKTSDAAPTSASGNRYAKHQANPGMLTPPVTYGSMSTERMQNACADMLAPPVRAGDDQALLIPTRVNDVLHYRDGRRVDVKITATP